MDQADKIKFNGWTLKRKSGELQKGESAIRLRPQPLQVLEELLVHPGEVVSREHLIARLWPKGIVDFDTALNSAVRRLRRVLGDDAQTPLYIETIPRRGYRFIGAIEPLDPLDPLDPIRTIESARPDVARIRGVRVGMSMAALGALIGLFVPGDSHETMRTAIQLGLSSPSIQVAPNDPVARSDSSVIERLRQARFFLERRSTGDLERAREHFEQVFGLDPTSAQAYAGLSSVYWLKTMEGEMPRDVGLPKLKASAERALSLDSRNAEAYQRLAQYSWTTGDRATGDQNFRRALKLNPDDPLLLSSRASMALVEGRTDYSLKLSRRAVASAPLNFAFRYNLACTLYLVGHFDEALAVMRELLEFDPAFRADLMAYIWILNGRHQDAVQLALTWSDGPDKSQALALAYFGLGLKDQADQALATLIAQTRNSEPLRVAEVYAYRRELDHAFDWLNAGTKTHYGQGIRSPGLGPSMMKFSPFISPLRADPRWLRWSTSTTSSG
jgi:DNA-binding winged helix-turn-helix (wHTH) protein